MILLPAGYGSLGDEAMVLGLVSQLHLLDPSCEIDLLSIYRGQAWPVLAGIRKVINMPAHQWHDFEGTIAVLLKQYKEFILLGADVLDGYYSAEESLLRLSIAELAADLGCNTTICGFSYNAAPEPELAKELQQISHKVRLCLRDPISYERVSGYGISNAMQVADVAFLMPQAPCASFITEAVEEWLCNERRAGRKVIAVNWSAQCHKEAIQAAPSVIDDLADFLAGLIKNNAISVLLLPHDLRGSGQESDVHIAFWLFQLIENRLGKALHHQVTVVASAAEAKRLAGMVDLVITGRMHLAIAALGLGKPIVGWGYQDKFEGLLSLFGLSNYLLSAREFSVAQLECVVQTALTQIDQLNDTVAARLPSVIKLARRNLPLVCDSPPGKHMDT